MEIDEEHRLQSTLARKVEFLTTVESLSSYISENTKVIDIGCGAGIYSCYFSRIGAIVSALDIVPKHIDRLRELAIKENLSINSYVGNALDLSQFKDSSFDVVLCLGPLYHLTSDEEHNTCIRECIRVVKPGGIIAFAYISPYSVFPCVLRGDISRASSELIHSIVDNKKVLHNESSCFWTDNYYYTPEDIEERLRINNLEIIDHLATDGQSIAFQSLVNSMSENQFEIWLEYHRKTCRTRSILGTSNHGLIIARKKGLLK